MRRNRYWLIIVAAALASGQAHALSPEAAAGKSLVAPCLACHDEALDPPKGPPLFGVQRRYRRAYPEKDEFITRLVTFVSNPSRERAIMKEALTQLGLMAPMPLPEAMLRQIAAYVYEESFPPPCAHWRIAVRRATERGDEAHAAKDRRQLTRFCK